MNDKKDKHIAEQVASSFNDLNNENFIIGNLEKYKKTIKLITEEKQLTVPEPNDFEYPDSIIDFIEKQSPEQLEKQMSRTSFIDWLNPSNSDNQIS